MASAHSSLPVPVSPSMSTATSDCATSSSTAKTSRIFSDGPSSAPKRSDVDGKIGCERSTVASLSSRAADGDDGAGADRHLGEARAAEEAAVGRAEVFDEHAATRSTCSSRCWRETAPSREHEVAAGRLADEVGAALEHELLARRRGRRARARATCRGLGRVGPARRCRCAAPRRYPTRHGHAPTLARAIRAEGAERTSSTCSGRCRSIAVAPPVEKSFHAWRSCCARIFWSSSYDSSSSASSSSSSSSSLSSSSTSRGAAASRRAGRRPRRCRRTPPAGRCRRRCRAPPGDP